MILHRTRVDTKYPDGFVVFLLDQKFCRFIDSNIYFENYTVFATRNKLVRPIPKQGQLMTGSFVLGNFLCSLARSSLAELTQPHLTVATRGHYMRVACQWQKLGLEYIGGVSRGKRKVFLKSVTTEFPNYDFQVVRSRG